MIDNDDNNNNDNNNNNNNNNNNDQKIENDDNYYDNGIDNDNFDIHANTLMLLHHNRHRIRNLFVTSIIQLFTISFVILYSIIAD